MTIGRKFFLIAIAKAFPLKDESSGLLNSNVMNQFKAVVKVSVFILMAITILGPLAFIIWSFNS